MISVLNQVARMGRVLHGHSVFLMVVDQANFAGGVRVFVVAENQPPISGDGQAPKSFQVAGGAVSILGTGRAGREYRPFREQAGACAACQPCRGQRFGITVFMQLLQSFMAKADEADAIAFMVPVCTVIPSSSLLLRLPNSARKKDAVARPRHARGGEGECLLHRPGGGWVWDSDGKHLCMVMLPVSTKLKFQGLNKFRSLIYLSDSNRGCQGREIVISITLPVKSLTLSNFPALFILVNMNF